MFPSPYALLQASKPKPPHTMTTQYDLFSLGTGQSEHTAQQTIPPAEPMPAQSTAPPARKTHYIADIHARHAGAMKHTRQQNRSL